MALAFVNRGRWVAACPFRCGGADIAEGDRFLCRLCLNAPVGQHPVPLVWPAVEDVRAIEAALAVRPTDFGLAAWNWNLDESIGYLLAENVEHGLFDPTTGAVAGDIGADQMRLPGLAALALAVGIRAELGG